MKLFRFPPLLSLVFALVLAVPQNVSAQSPSTRLNALVKQTGASPLADKPGVAPKRLSGIDHVTVFDIMQLNLEDDYEVNHLVVSQDDPGLASPFAAVGDRLPVLYYSYDGPSGNGYATVRARLPYNPIPADQVYCETSFVEKGWAYLLEYDADTEAALRDLSSPSSYVVTAEFTAPSPLSLPDAAIRGLDGVIAKDRKKAFDLVMKEWGSEYEQQARNWILKEPYEGEEIDPSVDPLDYIRTSAKAFRGPQGVLVLHTESMSDDLSDKGGDTRYTYVVDANGTLVARVDAMHQAIGVADFNGDGIDEVVTTRGLIVWDGQKWVFPTSGGGEFCD